MSQPNPAAALVDRILSREAPITLRQAAARGALPLPRAALARVFVALFEDPDEAVRLAAKASMAALTPDVVAEVLGDPDCAPEVFRHFAARASRDATLAERVAFHAAAPDDVLGVLAGQGTAPVVDLVLTNQERLLSTRGLLDRMIENPSLRPDQRGKILDILDRMVREGGTGDDAGATTPIPEDLTPEEAARILDVDVGELFAESEILDGEEFETSPDFVVRSAYKRILKLGPAHKAVLAMKGGREERMILIRDTAKVVALSVLKNPRLTEKDVEDIARLRSVSDDVLRTIGANREWAKRHAVVGALVRNPRTPQGISMNFISRLAIQELRDLARDRNVPELVRRHAKRLYDARTQKKVQKPGRK